MDITEFEARIEASRRSLAPQRTWGPGHMSPPGEPTPVSWSEMRAPSGMVGADRFKFGQEAKEAFVAAAASRLAAPLLRAARPLTSALGRVASSPVTRAGLSVAGGADDVWMASSMLRAPAGRGRVDLKAPKIPLVSPLR